MHPLGMVPEPDDRQRFRREHLLTLIEQAGTMKALADRTKTDSSHLSQIKNGTREMGEAVARRIERALGLPAESLDRPGRLPLSAAEPSSEYRSGVPVVGTAQLGDHGYWSELDYPAGEGDGFVMYPARDPNTYAVRVKGDSMRPRIKPGEFVVIEPNAPVHIGEEVLVQTTDGRSMIKQLGARRNGLVELISINEQDHRPITLEERDIVKMHHVGGIMKASMYYER